MELEGVEKSVSCTFLAFNDHPCHELRSAQQSVIEHFYRTTTTLITDSKRPFPGNASLKSRAALHSVVPSRNPSASRPYRFVAMVLIAGYSNPRGCARGATGPSGMEQGAESLHIWVV